jgi:hypothetical protein
MSDEVLEMNRQEISAFLANCKASEMLVYRDLGDGGTVVVASDGKKYKYSNDQLDQAEKKLKPRRTTKRRATTKTKKKPAAKSTTKPTTKPTTKQKPKLDPKLL